MKILNHYSIKVRLVILAVLGLVGMLAIAAESLIQTNEILLSEKQQQTQHLVEVAHSLIDASYKDFKDGKITEEQAKQEAIAAVMKIRYDNGNYFWINDMKAVMIGHAVKPSLNGKDLSKLADPNGKLLFTEFVNLIKKTPEGGVVDYLWEKPGNDQPVEKISYVKGFTPWKWVLGTGIYIDDVKASMWSSVQGLLIEVVVITFLIIILSFLIGSSVIAPIKRTTEALGDLVQGEGYLTQRLPINGNDEMSKLSHSFNEFITKIQGVVEKVQESAESIKVSSLNLSALAQKSLQSNQQQNAETAQIATASNEMLSTINEIANSAQTAANLAEGASAEAKTSKSIFNKSVNSVQELSGEITGATTVITELNNECASIDSVLSVIEAIAEQTNLLALNAAIEAARAGEQGRGFAVVADEVRTLAGRTQVATLEINEIIAQLQNKANEAVSAMSKSADIAEGAVTQANAASDSLDSIADAIISISDANHHISTASNEQSTVTQEIDERVTAIAQLSEESTDRSVEINSGSDEVSKLGVQLTDLIKTFKV
ncbi:methyl-accepting chemotaxis protein [Psychromonas algicola]|uniref:methyl-accepting chemotaxis protein n=1 Tax=Psychromonas algicola TaxID=2555642 RepID=UPI001068CB6C|nr:methyl-accepting chemotaxis protein [Psychromonas sp. RZ5]TEW48979.1 methyl-accepting chemotaxis protein [Psychromonas sp. RZ5]